MLLILTISDNWFWKIAILWLLIVPSAVFGQFGVIWDKTWGGAIWEEQNGIVVLEESNTYVFGGFSSSGQGFEAQSPYFANGDVWLIWADTFGNIKRELRYGGSGRDRLSNMIKAPDNTGDIIFVGTTNSPKDGVFDDPNVQDFGASDVWVARIDTLGGIVWQTRLGTELCEEGADITIDEFGQILVVGETHQSTDCFNWPFPPSEVWMCKLDPNGILLIPPRTFSFGEKDKPISTTPAADGGFFIVGETWPTLDFAAPDFLGNQFLIIKVDANLNLEYETIYGGGNQDSFLEIIPTIDNQFLILGFTDANEVHGWGTMEQVSYGFEDIFIQKMDQDGNLVWSKRYGGDALDWGYSALQNASGNYIVVGTSASGENPTGGKSTPNYGLQDYWILYLDENGDRIWDQSFGGDQRESCTRIAPAIGGGFLLGGHSESGEGEFKSDFNRGMNDQWVVRTGCLIGDPNLPDLDFVCQDNAIEVDATITPCDGCTYVWNDGFEGPIRNFTSTVDVEYSYIVTHKDGCVVFDTFSINFSAPPTGIFLSVDSVSCFGTADGALYIDGVENGTPPFAFTINGEVYASNDALPYFENIQTGFFNISVVDTFGCATDTSVLIPHPEEPLVSLPDDLTIELGETVEIQALVTPNVTDFYWTDTTLLSCTNCLEPTITPTEPYSTGIVVMDENGCEARDNMFIFVEKERGVFVPNAFSPNGDGQNEFITVYGIESVDKIVDFTIFDRRGGIMHQAQNFIPGTLQAGWNGLHRGEMMPSGTYVFQVTFRMLDGYEETFYGTFNLIL